MDNLDKIKYKDHPAPGWITKIDLVSGTKTDFTETNMPGLWEEKEEWLKIPGNEIEPVLTEDEIIAKSEAEKIQALENQKNTCLQLLNDSDKKVNGDWPYQDDIPAWIEVRKIWRDILKSTEIVEIPEKPF